MSWKGAQTFNLDEQGIVLVTGVNGAGKSSLFDAVCWAIYGRTTKALLADEVVNNVAKKDCFVKLDLIVNNKEISITRFRKHTEYGGKVEIEGVAGNWDTVAGAQTIIDSFINLPYDRFIQTFFFSQGDRRYFTNLKEADQRKVLSEIFQFEKFKEAAKQARAEIKELLTEVTGIRLEKSRIEGNLENTIQNISSCKKETAMVKASNINVEEVKKKKEDNSKKIAKLEEEFELLQFEAREFSDLKDKLDIEDDLAFKALAKVNALKKDANKTCPTCGTSLQNNKYKEVLGEYSLIYENHLEKIEEIRTKLAIVSRKHDGEKLRTLKTNIANLRQASSLLDAELKVHAAKLKDSSKRLADFEKVKKRLSKELEEITTKVQKKQKKVLYYEFWENGFGTKGIETFALKKILPHFNAKINEFLVKLPTKKGIIKATFSIEGTHLALNVDFAGANKYSGVSGGEKRRIDLAVSLALISMSGVSSNLMLLDEPFEGLEASSYSDVVKILDSIGIGSIFVTSHNSEIKAHFINNWEVEIAEGSSQLKVHTSGSKQIL